MFWKSWLNKKKPAEKFVLHGSEQEFTFIWYKKLQAGVTTFYTQKFKTKIKADNLEDAKAKLTKLVAERMKLCIFEESEFKNSDLNKIEDKFADVEKAIDNLLK